MPADDEMLRKLENQHVLGEITEAEYLERRSIIAASTSEGRGQLGLSVSDSVIRGNLSNITIAAGANVHISLGAGDPVKNAAPKTSDVVSAPRPAPVAEKVLRNATPLLIACGIGFAVVVVVVTIVVLSANRTRVDRVGEQPLTQRVEEPVDRIVERIVEKPVIVEKIVERLVPGPPVNPLVEPKGHSIGGAAAPTYAAPTTRPGQLTTNSVGMTFAYIPPCPEGFLMGTELAPGESGYFSEERQHRVRLTKGFCLAITEVTQAQWKVVMGKNPSQYEGDDLPADSIKFPDAVAFCEKLGRKEGRNYRLPTEAEWEYACRAGTTGDFGGSGKIDEMGWHEGNSDKSTHPVKRKLPNAWGLYDMHGNVSEWCSDKIGAYPIGEVTNPSGGRLESEDDNRVIRGGSIGNRPSQCRSAKRDAGWPRTEMRVALGLRVAYDDR